MKVRIPPFLVALFLGSFSLQAAIPASAVINEFNEKPEDTHELEEFIELYNPGDSPLVMTGWTLSGAVTYTFPDVTLAAHGYQVVALDPSAIATRYGFTALGPWSGKLSGAETINLKDAGGALQDSVTYHAGFPWPSAIDGQGSSAELINPGLDNNLGSSWRSSNGAPTPGAANSVSAALTAAPPSIDQVAHSPRQPASNQAVTITAKIAGPNGVGAASLSYQPVDPGAYIRPADAAYSTNWTTVPMVDTGTGGDATAGDSIYTAVLPASLQTNRRLVRYRITFSDTLGNTQTVPYADDTQLNFAYFVYDGLPDYRGSLRPGVEPIQTYSAQTLGSVPVYTLIANNQDVYNCQYVPAEMDSKLPGTLVYDGVVYDNITFSLRGQNSFYQAGKNKWRFDFNPGRDFQAKDNLGKPYSQTWSRITANACASPWNPANRGIAGVEESVGFKLSQLAGNPAPSTHYYQFRVIRTATETPPAGTLMNDLFSFEGKNDGQFFGDFWGLYMAMEPMKGNFLDEHDLPEGNLYKLELGVPDPGHLEPGYPEDAADYNAYADTVQNTHPTEDWWRANLDVDAYYTFHAINRLIGNVDLRSGDNHYFYHRSSDNRWVVIPWDLDLGFVPRTHQYTTIDGNPYYGVIPTHKMLVEQPNLALEYRNRAREILDLMASDPSPMGGQIGQLIDEFAQIVAPTGTTDNLANADAAMWNLHPRTQGIDGQHTGPSNHKGNFYYTPYSPSLVGGDWTRWLKSPDYTGVASHADMMVFLRDYATNAWPGGDWQVNNANQLGYGYQYLLSEAADSAIPGKPTLAYTGGTNFPADGLSFSASSFSDPQGAQSYASTQWRVSEIYAPGIPGWVAGTPRKYEIEKGWSGTTIGSALNLPASAVAPGRTYRARVRYQNTTGRWSNWSAPVQFMVQAPTAALIHYWNFNNSSSLETLLAPTVGTGSLSITLGPLADAAYLADTGKDFAGANAQNGDAALTHLRVNNPIGTVLTFKLPTTGYHGIVVAFETRRSSSGSAAELENWSYTVDGTNYLPFRTLSADPDVPQVIKLDFSGISTVDGNPNFGLKVTFAQGTGGLEGNHRFDDFTVNGTSLSASNAAAPGTYAGWVKTAFTDAQQLDPSLTTADADPDGDGIPNFMEFALATAPMTKDAPSVKFAWSTDGTMTYPGLKIVRPEGVQGVVYELLASDDLVTWTSIATTPAAVTSLDGDKEEILLRDVIDNSHSKRFLRLRVTPSVTTPATGSYAQWAASVFTAAQQYDPALSGPAADPDDDGQSNFMEFALGSDPLTRDRVVTTPVLLTRGGETYQAVRFQRPQGVTGVLYRLLASDDLVTWSTVSTTPVSVTALTNGFEQVTLQDVVPAGSGHRFLRVEADDITPP